MFLAGNGNGKACSCRTLKSRISEVVERLPNHFQICHPFQALWSDLFLCGSNPWLAVSPKERSPKALSAIANSEPEDQALSCREVWWGRIEWGELRAGGQEGMRALAA